MAIKMARKAMIDLSKVVVDFERNFARERDSKTYDDAVLRQDLATRGQITVAKLRKIGEIYYPLQGNRRAFNLKKLAEMGIEDPRTCKKDDQGKPVEGTGKPFSQIEAEVYEDLTDREAVELMMDHGNVRGLSRAELQYAFEGLFQAGYVEREIAHLLGNLLIQHYPPSREIKPIDEDKGADFLNFYRGVIQAAKNRWRAPRKLHDLAMEVLRGKQKWPTKAEISDGLKIHEDEVDKDTTGRLDRENTGPKFNEWFDRLVSNHTPKPGEEGESRGKSISSMNRAQIEDLIKVADSPIVKYLLLLVLRDPRVKPDGMPVVAKLTKEWLNAAPKDQQDAFFDGCWDHSPSAEADSSKPEQEPAAE